MSRCSCGRELETSDRYCSRCGVAVNGHVHADDAELDGATDESGVDGGDANGETILLGTVGAPESVESTTEVQSAQSRRWVLLGVAVAALLMWGLFSWPRSAGEASETDVAGSDAALDETDQGSATSQTTSGSDTFSPSASEQEEREAEQGEAAEPGTSQREPSIITDIDGQPQPDRLVAGEPTGLGVVAGSLNETRVPQLLELDTGRLHDLDWFTGAPLGMIGSTLVVKTFGGVAVVDLSEPGLTPVELDAERADHINFLEVEDDLVWVFAHSNNGATEELIGFSPSGKIVERRSLLDDYIYWLLPPSSGLVVARAGGIYQRDGDQFQRASTGRLLAYGEDLLLVDECDARLTCGVRWIKRDTWETVDHPLPDRSNSQQQLAIIGRDQWIVSHDWERRTHEVRRIDTGELVRTIPMALDFDSPFRAPISTDGRWLVDLSVVESPVLVDLSDDTEWSLPSSIPYLTGEALIVDLSETMFASPVWTGAGLCLADSGQPVDVSADSPLVGLTRC